MKFKFSSIEQFEHAINECNGNVFLLSEYGDRYNLKSTLSQYVAFDKLLESNTNCFIWAENIDDQIKILHMLS